MRIYILAILLTLAPFCTQAQTQRWALGFKVGEPTGLNIRKYGDKNALDISAGTYGGLLSQNRPYRKGEYRSMGYMLNISYLWYASILSNRMIAYAGAGGQINSRKYFPDQLSSVGGNTRNISFGPAASAGLEYFSRVKSSSFFLEGGGYVELLPGFLFGSPQLSLGVRTNF